MVVANYAKLASDLRVQSFEFFDFFLHAGTGFSLLQKLLLERGDVILRNSGVLVRSKHASGCGGDLLRNGVELGFGNLDVEVVRLVGVVFRLRVVLLVFSCLFISFCSQLIGFLLLLLERFP